MEQVKSWWPDEIKAYLKSVFPEDAVIWAPSSFLPTHGRQVQEVRLHCKRRNLEQHIIEAVNESGISPRPTLRDDDGRLYIGFSAKAEERALQMEAFMPVLERCLDNCLWQEKLVTRLVKQHEAKMGAESLAEWIKEEREELASRPDAGRTR